ncbi:hypothetical protein C922_04421 [Plasmodium inui San Antonio 1]|uniref:Uncharacterized protein n=1 Tax=Plasmodium inui San Antonio 1 TaxID=1237626 RepID=W7A0M4_9APIC|nr:hypothetical protein C922_04421 [Plasmodium inui San Antonio 1]EUD65135.1 hypothetical protein C922_04421 [Plasmodium inui San Antonio 1]
MLEEDDNEFPIHLNASPQDEEIREELNLFTHQGNGQRTLNASIDDISNDSLCRSKFDILKNEKDFTETDNVSEQAQFHKLIREHRIKEVTESAIYRLLKRIDRTVESEILTIMRSDFGYNNNERCNIKCRIGYRRLLNGIKKYRIFLPLIIFGAIPVVLMPSMTSLSMTETQNIANFDIEKWARLLEDDQKHLVERKTEEMEKSEGEYRHG